MKFPSSTMRGWALERENRPKTRSRVSPKGLITGLPCFHITGGLSDLYVAILVLKANISEGSQSLSHILKLETANSRKSRISHIPLRFTVPGLYKEA